MIAVLAIQAGSAVFAAPPSFAVPTSTAGQLLQQADDLRSADAPRFAQLLEELQRRQGELDDLQREKLRYLAAFKLAYGGSYPLAIPQLQSLHATARDPRIRLRAGSLLVNLYTKARRFSDSLRQLALMQPDIDRIEDINLKATLLIEAAYLHIEVGEYRQALAYVQRMRGLSLLARDVCYANYLEMDALYRSQQLLQSTADIRRSINQCLQENEPIVANSMRTVLAHKWFDEGRRDEAVSLLSSHVADVEATHYAYLIAEFKALLARLMMEKGDLPAAETLANEAIAQGSSMPASYSVVDGYQTLYRVAQARGDDEQALVYFRRYADADKAYLNEVKTRELAYQMVQHETAQNAQKIKQLDDQNQLLRLQQQLERQATQNTRLLVVLMALLLGGLGVWIYRTRRIQRSLQKMAQTDLMTDTCNRHYFTDQAERMLAQCAATGEDAALIMFDLDHFKNVNDRFGHAMGDWALKHVASAGKHVCRRFDVLGRLGGEEFAFLMRGCDLQSATRLAEDCRARIAAIDTSETGHSYPITASFGVASTASSGYQLSRLLSHADRALYRAKHLGRNRVCVHEGAATSHDEDAEPVFASAELGELRLVSSHGAKNFRMPHA
ncbi:sensor domain-containing diguanylate cyclase [Pseudoxanthomonas dokdonensis]|uniref:diguanylate cyclase n=1 Tax=Pseudoxanthomonas dokdonensis TaxID=344882 RepID=A0A0R0CG88_9GAMM|nr:GGDEF domain-containing protein [Pseudoxanthomonas dokdonensis]KRG68797.1 hypothetical protein ABB29_09905 [Pseudoxanthomonas dokdonensis]